MLNFRQILCGHEYELKEQQFGKSEADWLKQNGLKPNTHTSFKRGVLTWFKCKKCGKWKTQHKHL